MTTATTIIILKVGLIIKGQIKYLVNWDHFLQLFFLNSESCRTIRTGQKSTFMKGVQMVSADFQLFYFLTNIIPDYKVSFVFILTCFNLLVNFDVHGFYDLCLFHWQYEKTIYEVYNVEGAVDTLIELMQIYREKGTIFNSVCMLLGILGMLDKCRMVNTCLILEILT